MRFSIIVVCLNPGRKLKMTLESILSQKYEDYEIVIKDGGSRDGSVEEIKKDPVLGQNGHIRIFEERDTGIYDAMNQAVLHAQGDFFLFLNCGDAFYNDEVLSRTSGYIDGLGLTKEKLDRLVLYGDTYSKRSRVLISSPARIDTLTCYRNIPCHQSCFYGAGLCREKPYDPEFLIRADYDHFLWCHYEAGARMEHIGFAVSCYEGGGFSEEIGRQKKDGQEQEEILRKYMNRKELLLCKLWKYATLTPLRKKLNDSRGLSHWYLSLKEGLCRTFTARKKWFLWGAILFFLEMALLVWPVGLAGEDTVHFLAGEGKWMEEAPTESDGLRQMFSPKYKNLQSVGIYLTTETEDAVIEGSVDIAITDEDGNILWEKETPYSHLYLGSYTDFVVNLQVDKDKQYGILVECRTEPGSEHPKIGVCGKEQPLAENGILYHGEEWAGVQLLTRYRYTDTVPVAKAVKIFFLGLATMLALAFGLPDNRYVRKGFRLLLFVLTPVILGTTLELLSVNTTFLQPRALYWNIGMMYLMQVTVLLWTGSLKYSVILTNVFLTFLYSASHYLYLFRGNPLRINDFTAIRTAANVVNQYSLRPDAPMAMAWAVFLFFMVCAAVSGDSVKIKKEKAVRRAVSGDGAHKIARRPGKWRLASAAAGVAVFAGSFYLFLHTEFLENSGFQELTGVNQQMTYQFNGYLISSCLDVKNSRVQMLEGYTRELAEEILKEASSGMGSTPVDREELPHIILIMNESFSDLRVLGNLEISEENMENFYSLDENTIRGYVNTPVLGGGTANAEFEVFTGCSMGLLPTSFYPYQQCFTRPLPSLVSHIEDAGYTTYSMHPETELNYNRVMVYESLGFDRKLWTEDFVGSTKIHYGASDRDTYHKVEELFENRAEGERMFIFDLTIQNHGGYTENDFKQTIKSVNAPSGEADNYLSLIKESDEAFGELIDYFAGQDEKVIICMFGDHQPKFTDNSFYENIYRRTEGLSEVDKLMNQYKAPFIIWANYEIPKEDGLDISMNYLGVLLQKTVGIPLSPYFAFLDELQEKYPIVSINGCVDKDGNYYSLNELSEELEAYRILQYRYLFDMEDVPADY